MRRFVAVAFLFVVILGIAVPAQADARSLGRIVVLNGRTEVAEGETATEVVVFRGRTVIDGDVNGSVVVFDGATRISGDVRDNVLVFRGNVVVTSGAHIGGDLVTNTRPDVDPVATIDGERRRVANLQFAGYSFLVRILVWLAFSVSVLVLGLLMVSLLPGAMESAARASRTVGATLGWGLLMLIGLPVSAVLVSVTLVGLPLGLALLLGLWLLFTLGYTVGTFAVGRWILKAPRGRMKAFLAGWGIARALALIPVVGGLAWTLMAIAGLGATTVAVWRSRRAVREAEAGAAPAAGPPLLPPPPAAPATEPAT
ncbi:MAG TPA: hypothetical protein VGB19_10460 [Actinomycetota bacterium]